MAGVKAYQGTHTGKQIDDLLDKIPDLVSKLDAIQSGDKSEVLTFEQPLSSHTVNHHLNKNPSVTVVELNSKKEIIADVQYNSNTQLTISFSENIACIVYLN